MFTSIPADGSDPHPSLPLLHLLEAFILRNAVSNFPISDLGLCYFPFPSLFLLINYNPCTIGAKKTTHRFLAYSFGLHFAVLVNLVL